MRSDAVPKVRFVMVLGAEGTTGAAAVSCVDWWTALDGMASATDWELSTPNEMTPISLAIQTGIGGGVFAIACANAACTLRDRITACGRHWVSFRPISIERPCARGRRFRLIVFSLVLAEV